MTSKFLTYFCIAAFPLEVQNITQTCATLVKIHPPTKLRVGSKMGVNILLGFFRQIKKAWLPFSFELCYYWQLFILC